LLVAKLKQVKRGLLHDLLTRGIDDNGELRDPERHPEQFNESVLGKIPKAWSVTELGSLLEGIDAGWSPACIEAMPVNGAWGVLKVSAVTGGAFDPRESKTLPEQLKPRPDIEVFAGDILLARANGVAPLVGITVQVITSPRGLMLSDKLLRLRPIQQTLRSGFLARLMGLASIRRQVDAALSGSSGQRNISQKFIRMLHLPLPSTREQDAMVAALRAPDERQEREMDLLSKLRTLKNGLMEDLLTGRVRVADINEQGAA
jgi:type I restriction enzyme S subunit